MSHIQTSKENGIAHVRLTRPEKMNALTSQMFVDLSETIQQLEQEQGVRCVVLSGEGRSFCAGIDLETLAGDSTLTDGLTVRTHGDCNLLQHAAYGWRELRVPVIAAIHGYVFGAGFQVALGADIRIASPETQMSFMEARWGLIPDVGGMALIRNLVREDYAREIVLTGRKVDATEGKNMGIVTHVKENPLEHATALAQQIASLSPESVRAAKRLLNHLPDATTGEVLLAESQEQEKLLVSKGHRESLQAHIEGRAPHYED